MYSEGCFVNLKRKQRKERLNEVYNAAELDINDFFKVAKRFKNNKGSLRSLSYDSKVSSTPRDICDLFGTYFGALAKPSDADDFDHD